MSLPDLKVLNRFLDDYLEIRDETHWNSAMNAVADAGKQAYAKSAEVVSAMANSLPFFSQASSTSQLLPQEEKEQLSDKERRSNECLKLKALFLQAKNVKDWIVILLQLGKDARKVFRESKSSLFGRTLHAIRTYLIAQIQSEKDYLHYLETQETELDKIMHEIMHAKLHNLDCEHLEKARDELLYTLADCGHLKATILAATYNLFPDMTTPDKTHYLLAASAPKLSAFSQQPPSKINCYKPWYYQAEWHVHFREVELSKIKEFTPETYKEFLQRAANNSPMPKAEALSALKILGY